MNRISLEFIGWRPFEVVLFPEMAHSDFYTLKESAEMADSALVWIMHNAKNK